MYLRLLFSLFVGTLSIAPLCSSYAITATILLDLYPLASTEDVYKTASSPVVTYIATSSDAVYHLKPSVTTTPTWSNNTATSISSADASLLLFLLSSNQSAALFSFLSLVSSVPDEILQAGNSSAHTFFANISSCLTNKTNAIQQAISLAVPALKNAAISIEGRLTSAIIPLATSLAGDFTSAIVPAFTLAASIPENGAKGVASYASATPPRSYEHRFSNRKR